MSRTLFKFTKPPDGLTRRVMFPVQPSWSELSAKLESLYSIPMQDVGVSYIDQDGDEVTLSSEEELRDFYKLETPVKGFGSSGDAMKAVRFTVRDLGAMHVDDTDKPLPETPQSSNHRNTFGLSGLPTGVFEGDDWQHIPAFGGPGGNVFVPMVPEDSPTPYAFLEAIESDVSMSKEDIDDRASSVTQSDDGSTPKVDKGKGRATVGSEPDEEDAASTEAMVDEDVPHKPPVHVRDASQSVVDDDVFGIHAAETTVSQDQSDAPMAEDPKMPEIPDPPLPDLDDIERPHNPSVSLANDIAALLNSFSSVFATHPELTEGMRNIIRSASNGTYWSAHREAVARAANEARREAERSVGDVRRAAEEAHRAAEEAAGRRIAEAIGGVMRAFGQSADASTTAATDGEVTPTAAEPVTSTPHREDRRPVPPPRRDTWHMWNRDSPSAHPPHRRVDSFTASRDSFFPGPPGPGRRPRSWFGMGPGMVPPPPPPPPHAHTPPFPPPGFIPVPHMPPMPPMPPINVHVPPIPPFPPMPHFHMPPLGPFGPIPPPPPPPEPASPHIPGQWAPPPGPPPSKGPEKAMKKMSIREVVASRRAREEEDGMSTPSSASSLLPEEPEAVAPPLVIIEPGTPEDTPMAIAEASSTETQAQATEAYQTSKEAFQAAKERYRAERERYRKEKDVKRADKMRQINSSGDRYVALILHFYH